MVEKGSITIEATIIMPIVFISLVILIQMVMVLYDGSAVRAFEHQALADYSELTMEFGDLYSKPITIKECIDPANLEMTLLTGEMVDFNYLISDTDYILFRHLKITVKAKLYVFGRHIDYNHSTVKVVTSGPEVIRLIDFTDQVTSDFVAISAVKGKYSESLKLIKKIMKDDATVKDAKGYIDLIE